MGKSQLQELKGLEKENTRLKRIVADNETLHHKPSPLSWNDAIRPHVFTQPGPEADIAPWEKEPPQDVDQSMKMASLKVLRRAYPNLSIPMAINGLSWH